MEFYSDSRPNLIGPKIKMQLHNILKSQSVSSNQHESYFIKGCKYIYDSYMKNNLVIIFIVLIIIILLTIRYFNYKKQKHNGNNNHNNGNITENYDNLLNELSFEQLKHIVRSDEPSVDPTKSVERQDKEYVNYPPTPLPINLQNSENSIVYKQNIYPDPPDFENLNTPNYNYEAVHYNPRAYYHGTHNTYKNSVDTNIPNPIGLPVNFNSSTEKFVKYAVDANNDNIDNYQSILDNKDYNMTNNFFTKRNRNIDPPFVIY
jgi:cbb3-type cytochrome oxidase subunit 3